MVNFWLEFNHSNSFLFLFFSLLSVVERINFINKSVVVGILLNSPWYNLLREPKEIGF